MSQATWLWQQPGTSVTRKVRLGWLQLGQSPGETCHPWASGLFCVLYLFCLHTLPSKIYIPRDECNELQEFTEKVNRQNLGGEQKQPWHCNNGGPMVAVSISEVIHPLLSWYRGPCAPSFLYCYGSHTPAFYLWGSLNSQGRNLMEPSI